MVDPRLDWKQYYILGLLNELSGTNKLGGLIAPPQEA